MSRIRCQEILEPHHGKLWEVVQYGWAEYLAMSDSVKRTLTKFPIPRGNLVWALMSERATQLFANVEGVDPQQNENGLFLAFGGGLLLRFKKMGSNGRTASTGTARDNEWGSSEQIDFEGISSADLRVACGYVLDKAETKVESVMISQTVDKMVTWSYEIPPPDETGVSPIPEGRPTVPTGTKIRGRGESINVERVTGE